MPTFHRVSQTIKKVMRVVTFVCVEKVDHHDFLGVHMFVICVPHCQTDAISISYDYPPCACTSGLTLFAVGSAFCWK